VAAFQEDRDESPTDRAGCARDKDIHVNEASEALLTFRSLQCPIRRIHAFRQRAATMPRPGGWGGHGRDAFGRRSHPPRVATRLLAALALAVVLAPAARAHPDFALADGPVTLAPGEKAAWTFENHYHRVLGLVKAPAGASLTVRVEGAEGPEAGPGHDLRVDALLACCKGTFSAPRTVVVENVGASAVTAQVRLAAVHDGFAVTNDDAEPGALASTAGFGLLAAFLAGRARRRDVPGAHPRTAVTGLVALWTVSALLALAGMHLYGVGPLVGTLAATAHLPATGHAIMTTHAIILLVLAAAWIACAALWGRLRGRAAVAYGFAIGLGAFVACVAWALEYGAILAPAVTFAASGVYPLVAAVREARGPSG